MDLPEPEPGLVISYSYLWRSERRKGTEEGRKDRPCIIVAALDSEEGRRVMVVPVTHSPPSPSAAAVELPPGVKAHLKLDDDRSWVIAEEVNQFVWPGFDLRPTPDRRPCFGRIPPKLFDRLVTLLREEAAAQRRGVVRRD